ncbi:hypothetical protein H8356DRAFT_1336121 [Neocallimastix lanati (nom. inval.)]|nr:hypothetical protein H8356DRAFT_1336121 [Neocallimastix sp. JGI-2020a]
MCISCAPLSYILSLTLESTSTIHVKENRDGKTPLFCGCKIRNKDIGKHLIELKVNPNKKDRYGKESLLKLDKGSSKKPFFLCVYRYAAREKSCYGR